MLVIVPSAGARATADFAAFIGRLALGRFHSCKVSHGFLTKRLPTKSSKKTETLSRQCPPSKSQRGQSHANLHSSLVAPNSDSRSGFILASLHQVSGHLSHMLSGTGELASQKL